MSEVKSISSRIVLIIFAILAFGIGLALFFVLKDAPDIKKYAMEQVQTEFIAYATQVRSMQKLQVAELTQYEVFERSSSSKFLEINLPEVVVAISTPVTFTYTVDFNKPWKFDLDKEVLIVTVPDLEFNPPAPDLSETKFEIKKGSFFRDEQAVLAALKKEMTPLLMERAEQNKILVLEVARSSIEDFVEEWLKSKDPEGKEPVIKILFQSVTGSSL